MIDLNSENTHSGEVRIGVCGECGAPAYTVRAWGGTGKRPLRRTCNHTHARINHDTYTAQGNAPIIKRAG